MRLIKLISVLNYVDYQNVYKHWLLLRLFARQKNDS